MGILAVIPARKGSKGIPDKNMQEICGRSLIEWAWLAADSIRGELTEIVVSTDYPDLPGHMTRLERPAELCQDDTPAVAVMRHAIEQRGGDAVLYLQPTSPFRKRIDLLSACSVRYSAVSFVDVGEFHPARMMRDIGAVEWLDRERCWDDRQCLPPMYIQDGGIYMVTRKDMPHWDGYSTVVPIVVHPDWSIRIDTPRDLIFARAMAQTQDLTELGILPNN